MTMEVSVKKSRKRSAPSDAQPGKSATKKGKNFRSHLDVLALGMLALHLREQWKKSGRDGLVFLAEDENRAERLGGIVHALDSSLDVLVFPRLNTLPFDGLEPSREIGWADGVRSLRRSCQKGKRPILLISLTADRRSWKRLPLPASWSRISLSLKVRASYAEQDLEARIEELGYDLDEEAEYPGAALFHGATSEIFPAGALSAVPDRAFRRCDPQNCCRRPE